LGNPIVESLLGMAKARMVAREAFPYSGEFMPEARFQAASKWGCSLTMVKEQFPDYNINFYDTENFERLRTKFFHDLGRKIH
jgi:hypothetical protein